MLLCDRNETERRTRPLFFLSITRYKNINKSSSLIMITSGYTHNTHACICTKGCYQYFSSFFYIFLVVHLSNFTAPLRSTTRSRAQDLEIAVDVDVVAVDVVAVDVVVAVVIWANIQHLRQEIFVASYNNSISIPIRSLSLSLSPSLALTLSFCTIPNSHLPGNEIMNDVILLPLRCFHSRGRMTCPSHILFAISLHRIRIRTPTTIPTPTTPRTGCLTVCLSICLIVSQSACLVYDRILACCCCCCCRCCCCRVCVISAGNERSRAIICRAVASELQPVLVAVAAASHAAHIIFQNHSNTC